MMPTKINLRTNANKQKQLKEIADRKEQERISRFGGSRRSTRRGSRRSTRRGSRRSSRRSRRT